MVASESHQEKGSLEESSMLFDISSLITTPLRINQQWSITPGLLKISVVEHETHPCKGKFLGDLKGGNLSP